MKDGGTRHRRPARLGTPSSRAVSASSGRCWVRTNVGLADGFTDRFTPPSKWPLTCSSSQTNHVKNVPCPLYVRASSDAKRPTLRTGADSVRARHLTCSFTVMTRRPTSKPDNPVPLSTQVHSHRRKECAAPASRVRIRAILAAVLRGGTETSIRCSPAACASVRVCWLCVRGPAGPSGCRPRAAPEPSGRRSSR
jgi:hypothetical protein